ncbi:VOC family protein [Anaerofilum sp. BX8]|uniref:VOC family protein n=1 Tax=Anaerofilum hominis TaxID=2763016 RepID=A0A923I942_9FIRM|nr:VOC family protein [Anaerofilum hominis]MBC5581202.1 VOC family protein [Anaerofilum hominis]
MQDYIKRITHCTFVCRDYAATQHFYGEVLGLKKLFGIDYDQKTIDDFKTRGYDDFDGKVGEEWLSYYKVAPREFIELFNVPYNGKNDTQNEGFHHVCLMVEDVVAAARELEGKGVTLWRGPRWMNNPFTEPFDGTEVGQCGSIAFYIQDPEGNEIEVMQYTENSLQVLNDHD